MAQIFISYASADQTIAGEVLTELRAQGFESVFLSSDRQDGIRPGEDWERRIYGQLRACVMVLPLLSPRWLASPWCHAELRIGRFLGKKIYPVLVERCALEGVAPELQHIDVQLEMGGLGFLAERLQRQLGRRRARWTGDCPFPGLEAFDEGHAGVFFGRDADVQRISERVRAIARAAPTPDARRALILSGPSGVGKSSLMRAGVVPDLKRSGQGGLLILPTVRPRADLRAALAPSIAGLLAAVDARSVVRADLLAAREALTAEDPASAVAVLLADCVAIANARDGLLLPIDQGEELLAEEPTARAPQIDLLVQLMRQATVPLTVLLTARSSEAVALASALNGEIATLAALPEAAWREVIQGPLETAGIEAEDAFVDAVQRDAAGAADALPLVAHMMTRLWHERAGFTLAGYTGTGGLAASVSAAAEAIWQAHAHNEDTAAEIRRAFVPLLASIGSDGQPILGRLEVAAAPVDARPALAHFVERRLLRIAESGGASLFEASHEALLRRWPRLAGWLAESRDMLLALDAIASAAAAWERSGQADDYLDHRGDRLASAELALADADMSAKVAATIGLADYLAACRTKEAERAAEAARQVEALVERERRVATIRIDLFVHEAVRANDGGRHDCALRLCLNGWVVAKEAGLASPPALRAQLARAAYNDRLLCALSGGETPTDPRLVGYATWLDDPAYRGKLSYGADPGSAYFANFDENVGWIIIRPRDGSPTIRVTPSSGERRFATSPSGRHLLMAAPTELTMQSVPDLAFTWRRPDMAFRYQLFAVFDDGSSVVVPSEKGASTTRMFHFGPAGDVVAETELAVWPDYLAVDRESGVLCGAGTYDGDAQRSRFFRIDLWTGREVGHDFRRTDGEGVSAVIWRDGVLTCCLSSGRLLPDNVSLATRDGLLLVPSRGVIAATGKEIIRLFAPTNARRKAYRERRFVRPSFFRRDSRSLIISEMKDGQVIDPACARAIDETCDWPGGRSIEVRRPDGGTDAIGFDLDRNVVALDGRSGLVRTIAGPVEAWGEPVMLAADEMTGEIIAAYEQGWQIIGPDGSAVAKYGFDDIRYRVTDVAFVEGRPLVAIRDEFTTYDGRTGQLVSAVPHAVGTIHNGLILAADRRLVCTRLGTYLVSGVEGETIEQEFPMTARDPIPATCDRRIVILQGAIWDLESGMELASLPHEAQRPRFSDDGCWLAWGGMTDGELEISDARWLTLGTDALVEAVCAEKLAGAERWARDDLDGSTVIDPVDDPVAAARAILRNQSA